MGRGQLQRLEGAKALGQKWQGERKGSSALRLARIFFRFASAPLRQLVLIVLLFAISSPLSFATDVFLNLKANGGNGKQLGVGLATFNGTGGDSEAGRQAESMRAVLREDLLFSRLFSIAEGGPQPSGGTLDALAWSGVGAQVLVTGQVRLDVDELRLSCEILDVATGRSLYAKETSGPKSKYRRVAHEMANALQYQLSGQPGIALTRIVFVSKVAGHKELFVMDYDGSSVHQITNHHSIALLPKWSPDGQWIAFNSYRSQNPDAYTISADGRILKELSMRQGLNTGPHWAPDGKSLAITLTRQGDPELYLLEAAGKVIRRLTFSPGVDTSPTFSPNGQQIAFISDRSGSPELYVMDNTGADVKRITFGQWADAPAWSPKGDSIVYERQRTQGRFDVWMIDPAGRNNHQVSEAGSRNEGPVWSPDGRFIAFSSDRDGGKAKICVMGSDGSAPHCITDLSGECSSPDWEPLK